MQHEFSMTLFFVHDKKILHPTSSLTASKSITSPPNKSNSLIPLNNTETSRSNPTRNKLCAGLPCFFTLIGCRLSSASPARQDSTKPIASTDINLSIFAGAVICVSSRLNPLLFRQPNSVSSCCPYIITGPNLFPSPVFSARKWPFNARFVPPFPAICAFPTVSG